MSLSRRDFVAGLGLASVASAGGCGVSRRSAHELTLWIWGGGAAPSLLERASRSIPTEPSVRVSTSTYGGPDFDTKLMTVLAAQAHVPDMTFLGAHGIGMYYPNADQFLDLRRLGVTQYKDQVLGWKWQQGIAPSGSMIGYPMDIGPTALFYRRDIFEAAGLPTEPADVASEMSNWDRFFSAGETLVAQPSPSFITTTIQDVFVAVMHQGSEQYMTPDNTFIGDQEHVRRAWSIAVEAHDRGVSAGGAGTDAQALVVNGGLAASIQPAWWANLAVKLIAPKTKGKWRIALPPGGAGWLGGSFIGITQYCPYPEEAFKFITWLKSPQNNVTAWLESSLFPATPESYQDPRMRKPDPFFGDQRLIEVFERTAEQVPLAYESPYDTAISDHYLSELSNIEFLGKNPDQAWKDALNDVHRELARLGLAS